MRKQDEMEVAMNQVAIKHSWAFGVLSLGLVATYQQIVHKQFSSLFIILFGMLGVFFLSYLLQRKKLTDEKIKGFIIGLSLALILILVGGLYLGWLA